MKQLNQVLTAILFCSTSSLAQESNEEVEPPKASVRFMAIGYKPKPTFKKATAEDIKRIVEAQGSVGANGEDIAGLYEGVPIIQPVVEDAVPPKWLETSLTKEEENLGTQAQKATIGFNKVGGKFEIFANRKISLNKKDFKPSYVSLPAMRPNSENLVLLFPKAKGPRYWAEVPRAVHFDLSTDEYAGKSLIFKNFTKVEVLVEIANKKENVPAGKTVYFDDLPTGKSLLYRVSANKGKFVIKYSKLPLFEDKMIFQMLLPQHDEIGTDIKKPRIEQIVIDKPTLITIADEEI